MLEAKVKDAIKEVPDFPKPGISFKDITPLLSGAEIASEIVESMTEWAKELKPNYIAGIESRGFMFGFALAQKLGIGFIPIRKAGKLPREVIAQDYDLEYGQATIEIHKDDIEPNSRIIIHDDLLATGGTVKAATDLCSACGGKVVGLHFLVELSFLDGRSKLPSDIKISSEALY